MFKKIMAVIFSLAILAGCTANVGTEIPETVSETAAAVSEDAETTTAATTTTVTTETSEETTAETEEITEITVDTSEIEYIKEELQANWNDYMGVAELYAVDLNGDGVEELLVKYLLQPLKNGVIYVYDVSDGIKKLYEISARSSIGSSLYMDENETLHYIFWTDYVGSVWEGNYAYFDITYDSIKIPFYVYVHDWFDGGAHVFDYNIYKNCEFVPTNENNRNFDPEKAELIGKFDEKDIHAFFNDGESNEISETVQKEVFEGMTYFADVTDIYFGSSYNGDFEKFEDFDGFWDGAAPVLAEIYGSKNIVEDGVE